MPIPQGKADANKTRWGLPDNPSPPGFRCLNIRIPDDDYYQAQVIGFLYRLAQQNRYDRDSEKTARIVASTWQSAIAETLEKWNIPCSESPIVPTIETITEIQRTVQFEEIEVDMSNLRIETIQGKKYLEMDCGCGTREYFLLTQATVNPETGAISDSIDVPPSYLGTVPLTQEQLETCYTEAMADTVIGALTQFTPALFNYASVGAVAFSPVVAAALIGAVEIQQSIVAALNGDLTLDFSELGYTANEVISVFQSSEFRTFIKNRIGEDQSISRFALEFVAIRLLNNNSLNFPTPTYPVFAAWAHMANMEALNNALQTAAAQCASGTLVPASFPTVGNLLLTSDWALSFDLRLAPFEENAWFSIRDDGGTPVGQWIEGVGYQVSPNILEEPHAATRLTMDFVQGTGGDCRVCYVDYEYVPLLEGSTNRLQTIMDVEYDKDASWNGVREVDTTGWTSGQREITLRPYRVLNDTFADGGVGIVRRIAMAGTGANPFSGLVQDFT